VNTQRGDIAKKSSVGFHGVVRPTEGLDLFIRGTLENIERLRVASRETYEGDPNIDEISSADFLGELSSGAVLPPTGDLYFNVLTRLGEVAIFETIDSEIKEINGIHVRVATPAALYRLKKGTIRAQDHRDAAMLRERFKLKDEA